MIRSPTHHCFSSPVAVFGVPDERGVRQSVLAFFSLAALLALTLLSPRVLLAQDLILVDRTLAVVDRTPILQSDVSRIIRLQLLDRRSEEGESEYQRRVIDELIDQRLLIREAERFGWPQVPVEAIELQFKALEERFGVQGLDQALMHSGLDREGLQRLLARQLAVALFLEQDLGPLVVVVGSEIEAYYRGTLIPELNAQEITPPPLDEVREEIRAVLREQRLNEEVERRVEELRQEADIVYFPEGETRSLPPVVWRTEASDLPP